MLPLAFSFLNITTLTAWHLSNLMIETFRFCEYEKLKKENDFLKTLKGQKTKKQNAIYLHESAR